MTKANELVDAKINFISFVKKGANGDPLRILKSDDSGVGLDLAALNKSDDDLNVPVNIAKNEVPEETPGIDPEVIQKLNLVNMARAMQSSARHLRHGARAGYRYARRPSIPRNLQTAAGHLIRSRSGAAGVIGGLSAGRVANRITAARMRGARIGQGIRAGYGVARSMARSPSGLPSVATQNAFRTAYQAGARRSLAVGARAGIGANRISANANAFRTWVRDAGVRRGGYWRRNA